MSNSVTDTYDSDSSDTSDSEAQAKSRAKYESDSYDSELDSATAIDSSIHKEAAFPSPESLLDGTTSPFAVAGAATAASPSGDARKSAASSRRNSSASKSSIKKRRFSQNSLPATASRDGVPVENATESDEDEENESDEENAADSLPPPPEVVLRRTHRRIRKLLRKASKNGANAKGKMALPFDVTALDDFIRCIPLTRIIFGDFHWRLARSHADLALAYLDLLHLPSQSLDHATTAKTLLTQNVHLSDNPSEKVGILETFLVTYFALGRSSARLDKDSEAEKALQKAEKIHSEFAKLAAVDQIVAKEWEIKLSLAIARINAKKKSFLTAEDEFHRCLQLLETFHESPTSPALVPVLLDLARMKLSVGTASQIESSIDSFLRAHTINVERQHRHPGDDVSTDDLAVARSALALGQAYAALDSDASHASAEAYVRKAAETMQAALGSGDEETQTALLILAKLLVRMTKTSEAVDVLKSKIRGRFELEGGEFSEALASDHNLVASIHLAGGDLDKANAHLKKCLEIRKVVLGPNHRKTKDTLATINSINH